MTHIYIFKYCVHIMQLGGGYFCFIHIYIYICIYLLLSFLLVLVFFQCLAQNPNNTTSEEALAIENFKEQMFLEILEKMFLEIQLQQIKSLWKEHLYNVSKEKCYKDCFAFYSISVIIRLKWQTLNWITYNNSKTEFHGKVGS